MMKKVIYMFTSILAFACPVVNGQDNNPILDSLLNVLKIVSAPTNEIKLSAGSDTIRINTLNEVSRQYLNVGNHKLAIDYAEQAKLLSEKLNYKKGIATSINNIGNVNNSQGDYDKALEDYLISLKVWTSVNQKEGMSKSYNNIGGVYLKKGNYTLALSYYLKSLKIKEEIGDLRGTATSYGNIGIIYNRMGNYEKALDVYFKSLEIQLKFNDKLGMGRIYANIGVVYEKQNKFEEALESHYQALKIWEELKNKHGIAGTYLNIGIVFQKQGKYEKALENYLQSLKMLEAIGDQEGIASSNTNIGAIYMQLGEMGKAYNYFNTALIANKRIGYKEGVKNTYSMLAELYEKQGDYKQAFEYHKRYSDMKDTLLNESSSKQITEMNTKYESEKKEKDIQLLTKDKELQKSEIGRQKLIRNGFIVGLLLALLLAFVIFNRFQLTRKQKQIIESQNEQIVESINYSKRIQDSLLPSIETMQQALPGLFVFYLPKNIVSGDFYFYKEFNNYIVLACVDCTGHGVPGGFMSTLGSLLLDKITDNEALKPSEILTKLNDEIIRILHQQSGGELQDGMDLSICIVDKHNRKVEFSGARNGIIVVTNKEAKRYKASPLPVGGNYMKKDIPVERNFQTQSISLNATDWVYMYTDGFIEQIGGNDNSPMNYDQFEKQLINVTTNQLAKEKSDKLLRELDKWRGVNERTDDVLIIGFQLI